MATVPITETQTWNEIEIIPLRGELFSVEHLQSHARQLASQLQLAVGRQDRAFWTRFEANARFVKQAYETVAQGIRDNEPLTPDAEWLIDNFYVVEEQLREIRDDLPAGYLRELPKVTSGEPRVYHLALALIVHTDSAPDQESIAAFVREFQTIAPLTIGEIWALPIMLRLSLVENLARLAGQMLKMRVARETAHQLVNTWNPGQPLDPQWSDSITGPPLVMHLLRILADNPPDPPEKAEGLERLIHEHCPNPDEMIRDEHRRQAANQVTIGNIITSMRLISALDWVQFFEQTNLVERVLRQDPTGIYGEMDFESRDRYRHAVEHLAKHSQLSDVAVAEMAIRLAAQARSAKVAIDLRTHVGFWLIDEGRPALEEAVDYRPPLKKRLARLTRRHRHLVYLGGLTLLTTAITVGIGWGLAQISPPSVVALLTCLALLPASEIALQFLNLVLTRSIAPQVLPKLDLKSGIPNRLRTAVVIPSMLGSRKDVEQLLQRLEMHFVSNSDPQLCFALLTDFGDADQEKLPQDEELLTAARAGIQRLNDAYAAGGPRPFYLFHRPRKWNDREQKWMGWERKRGKLVEFNRLLLGQATPDYLLQEGDMEALIDRGGRSSVQFVITLDSDTQLPLGTARRLIGTIGHPLNRARFDGSSNCISHGYSIVQPRIGVRLTDGNRSWYARIFANSRGIDPYVTAASDVYQDWFDEGTFTGKGIYDLHSFESMLDGVFLENQILSHDLIEGVHVRTALASDIELIDGFPARYDADARRMHRWVRGDWQILPWLFRKVPCAAGSQPNPLSLLSRWKILDNLRRSLVPIAATLLLIASWMLAPQSALWIGGFVLLCVAFPLFVTLWANFVGLRHTHNLRLYLKNGATEVWHSLVQSLVLAACLPHKAFSMADAIVRTLYRMTLSRRHLLEWETADATERRLHGNKYAIYVQMGFMPVLAWAGLLLVPSGAWLAALPWLLLWMAAPIMADWISRPIIQEKGTLSEADLLWLRLIARKTWAYFESCVAPQRHWLPPDNLQEYPRERIAERISPTNEGFFLTSALAARDFGYLGIHALADLWERNLDAWCRLAQFRGHFYNWYDTTTLQPLTPRYISTVDSGNLAACLLVVQQGIQELTHEPILAPRHWLGLRDTVAQIQQTCEQIDQASPRTRLTPGLEDLQRVVQKLHTDFPPTPTSLGEWRRGLELLHPIVSRLEAHLEEVLTWVTLAEPHFEFTLRGLSRWLKMMSEDYFELLSWEHHLTGDANSLAGQLNQKEGALRDQWQNLSAQILSGTSLSQLAQLETRFVEPIHDLHDAIQAAVRQGQLSESCTAEWESFRQSIRSSSQAAAQLLQRYETIARHSEQTALGMDFAFLYNEKRRLFAIGFNLEDGRADRSHYDMLCSEARLSSHFAIAKGDVDPKHWFQLGRQMTFTAGQAGLLSWGGTMFEFLMPLVFQRCYDHSLLWQASTAAVARQQEYGQQTKVPWGISESAFASLSANTDYQYQSFGVPGLGLKRGLADDLVIAPYATMLALPLDPIRSVENLRVIDADGGNGRLGFYEAVDYTSKRLPLGVRGAPVRCYMSHHQGMSLNSISNTLDDRRMEKRFHSHPLIRATELLLQERIAATAPLVVPHQEEASELPAPRVSEEIVCRRLVGFDTPTPRTHLLSNGSYSVMVTNTGGGYSQWKDLAVTRWRPDTKLDDRGQFLYLRDVKRGHVWSATYQPTRQIPESYEVIYAIDKAEFKRRDGDIETRCEITVCPENNMELRQLKITNHGKQRCELEITSYAEVVLAPPSADLAHPAFQKLFVETEYLAEEAALIARRRPRNAADPPLYGVHVLSCPVANHADIQYESSRQEFLGRLRQPHQPRLLGEGARLSGTVGLVLDPIFSLRCRVVIRPEESITLAFSTGVANNREEALRLADQFHDLRNVQRSFELSWAYSQVKLHHLQLTAARAQQCQQLATYLLYPHRLARGSEKALLANRQGQATLWRYGISGDRPILLVKIAESEQVRFVRDLLIAQQYWHSHGLVVDLAVLNGHPGSYFDELHEQLQQLVHEWPRLPNVHGATGFLLRAAQMDAGDLACLETVAAVVLDAKRGWSGIPLPPHRAAAASTTKSELLPGASQTSVGPPAQLAGYSNGHAASADPVPPPRLEIDPSQLEFWNGWGGFAENGKEYCIRTTAEQTTPMPWANVIANPQFGCLTTESGGGYTWYQNSRENKLTTWSNDPILDKPGEQLYLYDEQKHQAWRPLREVTHGERWAQHGQGYSRYLSLEQGIRQTVTISIAAEDAVKLVRVQLRNERKQACSLAITYYAEMVLGVQRESTQMHLVSEMVGEAAAIAVRNPFHAEFPQQVAYLQAIGPDRSYTADRCEFLGRNGTIARPRGVMQPPLSGTIGAGIDPCLAAQTRVHLQPGEETEVVFLLGVGADSAQANELVARYQDLAAVQAAFSRTVEEWNQILESVQVATPNRALDLLVNRWLLYQTLACRMWGRSALYQSGGAYGFRDQLQDAMALVYSRPDLVREHLLRAAARQYREGDVQHWWHPPLGRGTRTRFSDDLLWLPFVTAHYAQVTGDRTVLQEEVPFLESPLLAKEEEERYETPAVSSETASLYEHCLRAIDRGFHVGEHGLPLMGCGDWNDGMNKVGTHGKGESVWVGWFLLVLLDQFLPLMDAGEDHERAESYRQKLAQLRENLETHAWDGEWYRRAFFDDGTPLGSRQNDECQIDSIAQTWAVLANAPAERTTSAMRAVFERLVKPEDRIVMLFAPPFDQTALDPGYIKGYLPGVRENGGQYTHPVLWLIQALTVQGDCQRAMEIFDLVNPILHGSADLISTYQVEPYVVAADVYSIHPQEGRGGWTWYTGSAAWTYRVALENLLGFQLRSGEVSFKPCLPSDWREFTLTHRTGDVTKQYRVRLTDSGPVVEIEDPSSTKNSPAQALETSNR